MNIELATPEDAEEWRYHLDECRVMNESGIVVTRTDLVCPLTCVVPDDIACLDVGSRLTANVAFTLVGQQVTLVSHHEAECRGGPARTAGTTDTWKGTITIGTATVVNVVKVWREERVVNVGGQTAHPTAAPCFTGRLLMQIEATIPERPQ